MRIALAQLNPTVGDVAGNTAAVRDAYLRAVEQDADLVVAGELALSGYPPEDLLLKPAFVRAGTAALVELAGAIGSAPLVVGVVEELDAALLGPDLRGVLSSSTGERPLLANAAAVLRDGAVVATYRKQRLPNYGVFDEGRWFRPGTEPLLFEVAGVRIGVTICEDLWGEGGPVQEAADAGARLVLNLNASPYERGKRANRERWAAHHAAAGHCAIAYVNQVGGQDEVVFDGDSFVVQPDGAIGARGAQLATDLLVADIAADGTVTQVAGDGGPRLDPAAEAYGALVLGTRDYVLKNGFSAALVGVSGGLDSALVATIAVDALGAEQVTGVAMPSPYSSPGSLTDARALCDNLGAVYLELPIAPAMRAFDEILAGPFAGTEPGVAEENVQSRIRGLLLMALSNKRGDIVLATGNKSEYAVGYSTLYGDMAGGFAVIKDVPKLLVYELAEHVNAVAGRERIPRATIDKPPSAELRPDQLDTDSLPPYEVLDPILAAYVEQHRSVEEIIRDGYDEATVRRVVTMVDRAEYKRRQAAPGVKITGRAFGKDRRPPITQRWSG
jgi:NAD+ synthase (glutamine-hydrolysing)